MASSSSSSCSVFRWHSSAAVSFPSFSPSSSVAAPVRATAMPRISSRHTPRARPRPSCRQVSDLDRVPAWNSSFLLLYPDAFGAKNPTGYLLAFYGHRSSLSSRLQYGVLVSSVGRNAGELLTWNGDSDELVFPRSSRVNYWRKKLRPALGAARGGEEISVEDSSDQGVEGEGGQKERKLGLVYSSCPCGVCTRRGFVASMGALFSSMGTSKAASASLLETSDYEAIREKVHPSRAWWYEELFAQAMARTMKGYEAEVADQKRQLFKSLEDGKVEKVLELGIGTGPNLKYYGSLPYLQKVVGVDPNLQMAKFCSSSATAAGLSDEQFEFVHAVGEGIPVLEDSMDAVVCTLTLCSVLDLPSTLGEIKRVLKPGGAFLFVEHVAAPEGSRLRFFQGLLDPIQQWVADGCHLSRNTLQYIEGAQFSSVQAERFSVESVHLFSPHIKGVAYK